MYCPQKAGFVSSSLTLGTKQVNRDAAGVAGRLSPYRDGIETHTVLQIVSESKYEANNF
jgi:hypothetical protein